MLPLYIKPSLKMNKISSFAVFDLETTGIPAYNFNKTSITELSVHGFSSDDIQSIKCFEDLRVNHKLTLLFNPRKVFEPEAEKITGLNNYMLEKESCFDTNAANVFIGFLKHLRKPVCLVAHNGNKFDFPVLKQALEKLQMELPSDILCIDSLVAIKDLENPKENELIDVKKNDCTLLLDSNEQALDRVLELDKKEVSVENVLTENESNIKADQTTDLEKIETTDWQKLNETTPKRHTKINLSNQLQVERNPKRKLENNDSPNLNSPKSRRSLFTPIPTKFGHNKLGTIYERLFNDSPKVSHYAEADVVTLKEIMFFFGRSFVEYAEANAVPFSEIKKLGAR